MKLWKHLLLTLAIVTGTASSAFAQTFNATTLSTALGDTTSTSVVVTSATGAINGYWLYVDREAMLITNVAGTTITVQRGTAGFNSTHFVGAPIYIGAPSWFNRQPPTSTSCPSGPNIYIDVDGGGMWACQGGIYRNLTLLGPAPAGAYAVSNGAFSPTQWSTTPFAGGFNIASGSCYSWNSDTWLQRTAAGGVGLSAASCGGANNGTFTAARFLAGDGAVGTPSFAFVSGDRQGFYRSGTSTIYAQGGNSLITYDASGNMTLALGSVAVPNASFFQWANGTTLATDAANTLALRNGTNAQSFNIYNTYTDAANFERGFMNWSGNQFQIGTTQGGTGVARNLNFITSGSGRWQINTNGHFLAVSDNTYDIGASGATRPRTGYFGTSIVVAGTTILPNFSGTSSSIGGSALLAGACASTTVSVTGATTAMAVSVSPVTYPGDGNFWMGYVSASNTVTVKVCAAVAGTPTASTYNVRVIQ